MRIARYLAHGTEHYGVFTLVEHIGDEHAVDLQCVDRQMFERAQ